MEYISQILSVGILATLAMTAFSYLFSYIFKDNFKEPQLLNYLLDNSPKMKYSICREHIIGWAIHFSIGILFVLVFKVLQLYVGLEPSILVGALFGFIAGLLGVGGWITFFLLHPKPPRINKFLHYLQLIFAHIIFGITMILLIRGT